VVVVLIVPSRQTRTSWPLGMGSRMGVRH